ncbi:MAG: hypothetical protein OXG62_08065 [Nitrospinae bacterium]|nr:hypothetical protein [Nitrospinota bacterium]
MAELFTAKYMLLWALAMAAALFLPVRQLIWVLYVRRAERDGSETSDEERLVLKKRAGMTAVLLCFVFSYFYMSHLFRGP